MRRLRRARTWATLIGWAAAAFAAVLLLLVSGALLVGEHAVVVLSGRALPAIGRVAMLAKTPLGLIGVVILPLSRSARRPRPSARRETTVATP